tara:strand:- start:24 stop:833 length:810 start_codon:yes stop_codon:yes gene_type:complete
MKQFKDQLKRTIEVNFLPKKIISLVPSQTELLYDLGLDVEIVGITQFCIHPKEKYKEKIKVGGTKNIKIDKIRALKPDLIIANKEENSKEDIEALAKEFPVWISDIYNLADSYKMITDIGELCNKESKAIEIVKQIRSDFKQMIKAKHSPSVAYIIWQKPMMSVNQNTFIHEMLLESGFHNVFKNYSDRYPEITAKELTEANPDYIFLSSEPYPFKENHLKEFGQKFPNSVIILVDGEMFSWYGSRLKKFGEYYNTKLYPLLKSKKQRQ